MSSFDLRKTLIFIFVVGFVMSLFVSNLHLQSKVQQIEELTYKYNQLASVKEMKMDILENELQIGMIREKELNTMLDSVYTQNASLRNQIDTLAGVHSRSLSGFSPLVTGKSGLKIDDVARMLAGTNLEGLEAYFLEIEQKNNVNALFAIAVSKLESGNGWSYLSKNNNNIFGFRNHQGWMSFESKEECVLYFGWLIERNYVGKGYNTVDLIGPKYAGGSDTWAEKIKNIMLYDQIRIMD